MTARSRTAPPRSLLFLLLVALLGLAAPDSTARAQTTGPAPQTVPSDWDLIPDGLGPGDQFRLLFVTSGTRDAQSSDIAEYNTYVQTAANGSGVDATIRGMSGEFRAVVSTASTDARDNTATTGTGVAIYWLGGAKAADNYGDFYDNSWDSKAGRQETGALIGTSGQLRVWTGSNSNGTVATGFGVGASQPRYGSLFGTASPLSSNSNRASSSQHRIYALSPVLTVELGPPPLTYEVPNDWALKPSGLGVNDEFRLLILTSTQRDATSSNIIDYNTHVADAVAAGHDDIRAYHRDFRALASTENVDARDNTATTGTGVPIYWLGGAKAADDYADFYDGNWNNVIVARDEDGDTFATQREAWTGSGTDGTEWILGTDRFGLGSENVAYGNIAVSPLRAGSTDSDGERSLYGLSPVFKVVTQSAPTVQTVPGDWPLIPSARSAAGAQFRLLFITSGERDAASANIGDYNAFVQGHAGSGHEAIRPYRNQFRALASTSAVDADTNTSISGTGPHIYVLSVDASGNFDGAKVADDYTDLFDGDWDAPANRDESGAAHSGNRVWTGTAEDTGEESTQGTHSYGLGNSFVEYGVPNNADFALEFGIRNSSTEEPLYALSPVFEVLSTPTAPTAPTVSDVTDVSARMSWGEPSFTGAYPIFQYQIRVRRCLSDIDAPCTSWTGWGYARNFGGSARTGLITTYGDDKGTEDAGDDETLNLQTNTRYQARVQARSRPDGTMDTEYGEWSEAKTFIIGPPTPTDLLATPGDTEITLAWQSSETDPAALSHYTVEYADNAAFTNPQSMETASSDPGANTLAPTELTVTGLTNEVEYHFRVRAVRGTATSRWSGSVTATPAPATDYDADNDGLIDVERLAQLNGIRYDLDGDGVVTDDTNTADVDEAHAYLIAFPNPVGGMGCPAAGCTGYELTADLDFDENGDGNRNDTYNTGAGWDPIGDNTNPFTATFEGNGDGHTISNLFINRGAADYVGLFGSVASGGVVRNVGVADAGVTGRDHVGALAGENEGRVSASWASGRVTGTDDNVGGLVGQNYGVIAASYSSATVTATESDSLNTGGLVGVNHAGGGSILASYATGIVTGVSQVGGLVGLNGDDITASYSTGAVSGSDSVKVGGLVGVNSGGTVTDSYWDTERSGQTTSDGATGKTSAELRSPTGYTDIYLAWNLDLDNADSDDSHSTGQDNPWDFGADYNYPTLRDAGGKQKGPGPVSGLTAAPNAPGNALVVTWNAPTDPGDGTLTDSYEGRYHNGTAWKSFHRHAEDMAGGNLIGTTFTIPPPLLDSAYRIELWALGGGTAHAESRRAQIGLPGPPRMSLTSSSGRIDVGWSAPSDTSGSGIAQYRLDWRRVMEPEADWTSLTVPGTSTSRSFTGLVAGGTYEFRIAATSADGTGVYAGPLSAIASDVINYDSDGNGLIEIRNLAQLNAVRWDVDGNGMVDDGSDPGTAGTDAANYAAAFPQAATGMGCPMAGCTGYELMADLDFDTGTKGDRSDDLFANIDDMDTADTSDDVVEGWEPLGTNPRFTAVFDGNGHTIANLFINRDGTDRLGLFSRLGDDEPNPDVGATIRNLVLTGANVTGDDRVGILAGQTYGPTVVSNVTVSGTLTAGDDIAGGLIGDVGGDTTIASSYSSAAVSGDDKIGGLVGENEGTILASYATGSVSGDDAVGGLVGDNSGAIYTSYSTGAVSGSSNVGGLVGTHSGSVTNSYWDEESSGQASSAGGAGAIGMTGTELRAPTGYTGIYSAWNIDLDADSTNDNPWDFGADYNYPTLRDAPGNQKRPGPVRNMSVGIHTGIGGNRVVAWLSPSDSGIGSITGYEYRISTDGGSTWQASGWTPTTGLARSFTFNALAGSSYTIEARAVSDAAHKLGVSRSVGPPQNAPRNPTVLLYTGRVDLFWDAPQDDGGPAITGYAVQYKRAVDTTWLTTNVDITGRTASITGLTDGTTYNLRVAAVSLLGPGTAYATIDDTPTAESRDPGAPTDLESTPGQGTITLSWKAPEDLGNPPLEGYTVQWRTVGQTWTSQQTATTAITINISGDGPFEVQVGARKSDGTTTYMSVQRVEILRPPGAPRHLGLYPGDGSIEVAWSPPADPGIPAFESYLLQYRKSADGVWQNWPHSRTAADRSNPGRQRTEITGLDNGAEYLVRVAAVSSDGAGAFAKGSATPFRLQDLPGVPENLRVYPGDSRLDVRWEAPDHPGNPPLTHYWVFIRQGTSGTWRGGIPRTVEGTSTVYKNLRNGRSYQVRVAACNRLGCGFDTRPVAATPQEGLERPDIERPPSAPRNLRLEAGDGQITVSWKAPSDPGKPADGTYLVEYRRAGTTDDWTQTRTGRTTATLRGLTNGRAYEVQVTAYNDHGGGVAGPQSVGPAAADTEPEDTDPEPEPEDPDTELAPGSVRPPTAPRNLRLQAGDGWIKVSWNTPQDIGDPDAWIGYSVETRTVGAAGSGGWFEEGLYQGTSATIDATNGQSHQVRVIAVNEHGQATAGPHTARPTAPEPDEDRPPTAPRSLSLEAGDGQIVASWQKPWDMGEEDAWLGYIVEVRGPGTGGWLEVGVYQGTSATIDYVDNGETYEVRVTAFNLHGQATAGPKRATPAAQ